MSIKISEHHVVLFFILPFGDGISFGVQPSALVLKSVHVRTFGFIQGLWKENLDF